MTQFRSKGKGKNRKTYPISERKPYGLTRNIAYSDVMALRKEGKRARLIKTNKKLDLYAPYESVISQNATNDVSSAPLMNQEKQETNQPLNSETSQVTINEVDTVIKELGTTLAPKDYDPPTVYSQNGKTYVSTVDNARVMMIYATLEGTISKDQNPVGPKLKIPKLDYGDSNSASIFLDPEQQKSFMKDLRANKDAKDVVLYKPSGTHETYVFIRGENWETNDPVLLGNSIKFMNQNGTNEELLVHIDPGYVKRALKVISAINKANNLKGMRIRFKGDYPLEISTGYPGKEFTALIAPRMEDRDWKSKDLISARMRKEGAI